jgi:hypothetical protein
MGCMAMYIRWEYWNSIPNAKFLRKVEVHTSLALFLLVVLFRRHVDRSLITIVMWVEVFGFYLWLTIRCFRCCLIYVVDDGRSHAVVVVFKARIQGHG